VTAKWLNPTVWVPRRRLQKVEVCDFCWNDIQPVAGGWYNPARDVWECLPCRVEGQRAELVRAAMSPPATAPQQELTPVSEEAA